ncbi:peptidylprolyl isomerase [Paenibacillus sp. MSJ-34]|uniref:foldase protein PrsA n=1 Tax=Paenibacillus sp. MSJ-34 TaxID=2841529 RepID=UPI001C11CA76|nr:peptidylprolyl isomerase [Paenibacillus sp. MSJ-34]MBU5445027.1 peptidylprolyl isomerase [Paenibacillus sp. MSJ-34]
MEKDQGKRPEDDSIEQNENEDAQERNTNERQAANPQGEDMLEPGGEDAREAQATAGGIERHDNQPVSDDGLSPVPAEAVAAAGTRRSSVPWMVLSAMLLAAAVYFAVANPFGKSEVVAKVNGEAITKDRLYDTLAKYNGDAALQQIISETLLDQAAKQANVTVTDQDIAEEINHLKNSFPSEDQFNMILAQQGMTEEDLKENMRAQVKINKIFEPNINITEESVKQFFDENKDMYGTPEEVRASHILVDTKEEAEEILKQLNNGADFAELAKEKSQDPGSKDQGGDLDFFGKGEMVPSFEEAAFALKNGEISGIVESSHGFHIIKRTDYKPAEPANFEDKKENIRYQLFAEEVNKQFQPWFEKLKSEAKIENFLSETPSQEAAPSGL